MKRIRAIAATTHVNLHREKLSLGALTGLARDIRESYIPMNLEHDIRYPPVGRVVSGEIVQLPDGEHALQVVSEIFEKADSLEALAGDGRRMRVSSETPERFVVYHDRGFAAPQDAELMDNLWALAPTDPRPAENVKKSLEPLPTLTILAGVFAIGAIASGFFEKLGADAYDRLRDFLAQHWRTRRARDEMLDLCFCVTHQALPLEVHVLISPPSARRIRRLFDSGLKSVDDLISDLPLQDQDIARVVLTYDGDALTLSYTVRGDCVPLPIPRPPRNRSDAE